MTSFHFGTEWSAAADTLNAAAKKASANAKKNESSIASLQELLGGDAPAVVLEKAVSELMLDVYNLRAKHGVNIATAMPAKLGSTTVTKIADLADDVPSSSLKAVRINLTGTYDSYAGLTAYLEELGAHPAALVRVRVQDRGFEASFRVYGSVS